VFYFNMEPQLKQNKNVLAAKSFTTLAKLFSEMEHVGEYS